MAMEKAETPNLDEQAIRRWKPLHRLLDNPVILKELRGRMRDRRAFILLTAYLTVISLFIGLMYVLVASESSYASWDPELRQVMGKTIFGTVVLLELLLISFIGPGLTSGAITSERERQTFDLLRTSLLPARSLVFGKLGSASIYLLLLIFTALPIQSLAFFLGGVGPEEVLVSILMLVVTAISFCALGLFYSSFMKRTLGATVLSYATILLSYLALGVFIILSAYLEVSGPTRGPALENTLIVLIWIAVSTNPLLAAILSEVILVEDQSLFMAKSVPFGASTFGLPSPWILYILIYLLVTVLMVYLSIRFVRRPDR